MGRVSRALPVQTATAQLYECGAPSPKPLTIELAQRGDALSLEVADRREPVAPAPSSLDDRILGLLADADPPVPFADLRSQAKVRAATLLERISVLCAAGRVVKIDGGYQGNRMSP